MADKTNLTLKITILKKAIKKGKSAKIFFSGVENPIVACKEKLKAI